MILETQRATGASMRQICRTLDVPRSTFYQAAAPTDSQFGDRAMGERIARIFHHHRQRYGYRRIGQELRDAAIVCAPARVRRLMKARDLRAVTPRRFTPRTSDGRADKPSPNLLENQPMPTGPNQVWTGDITYIPTAGGWLYLAVVLDLYSRKIVGWSLAPHMRASLVVDALRQAIGSRTRGPTATTIFHSDRGCQYSSTAFRQLLAHSRITPSMSARANPYHNAWTESFIGSLKTEMLRDGSFLCETDAKFEIFEYIEMYYNNQRKHSSLRYQTPAQFEQTVVLQN